MDEYGNPDADPTRHEVTLRDDGDERVWVDWIVDGYTAGFVYIRSSAGKENFFLGLDTNELSQLRAALDPAEDAELVRDMGPLERVSVGRDDGHVTLAVEELGQVARVLVLREAEAKALYDAAGRAEDELPRTEDEPHV